MYSMTVYFLEILQVLITYTLESFEERLYGEKGGERNSILPN